MNRETLVGGVVIALLGGLVLAGSISVARDWDSLRPRVSGDLAPIFELRELDSRGVTDTIVRLEDYRGQVVLLDFWATWCGPCRATMPRLNQLAETYGTRGLTLISINTEGARKGADAHQMGARLSPAAVHLSDGGRVADRYGVTTIPHLVLVDKNGAIHWVRRGGLTNRATKSLAATIEDLL